MLKYYLALDPLFIITGPLVEILLTMDPLTETNTVIYGLGAVKSLSCNQILCTTLRTAGVVEMLATYLNMSCQVCTVWEVSSIIIGVHWCLFQFQNDPKMPSSVVVQVCTRKILLSLL